MSERKVLTKYYPPDFDPSKIQRQRGPKQAGPKVITVRLMAPFSMKCTTCGEFIYKGRKFNARKEVTEEKYYAISVIRFYIRCTRCSAEITFKTDPKNMDYACEKGAKRNFEPWREAKLAEETEEERLDRLEREEAERDVMKELEAKTLDAKTEMQIADALDEIRTRNARLERNEKSGDAAVVVDVRDQERERQEREDEEAARRAFEGAEGEKIRRLGDELMTDDTDGFDSGEMPPPSSTFQRAPRKQRDFKGILGIKKKEAVALVPAATKIASPTVSVAPPIKKPALLVGYDDDSD
ncbi:hypothetical protein LTS18_012401 [Coniosporium uncinatum]|uniref:Uncharacterized protein n=1 Tax=Coniosporium uncinatum TaxID=93489 RepID=A0ACC3DJ17_9PEZI|nr:hypothetical protein LTS18_012401 [Coniosporium uncinatum]